MGTRVAASHFPDKNLTGVSQLLEDLQRLAEDHESADIVFLLGREETPVYAHRIMLMASLESCRTWALLQVVGRIIFIILTCKSFQNAKRGEVCRIPIPGCTVAPPTAPGGPAPIRLPHVQGDTFRKFILYVYTGKIMLQDNAVFEMMSLAQDLGVEELRSTCEDYVTSTLSPLNASTFLAAAMDIQERTAGDKYTKPFVDRCVAYVGENASECVQTNSFLTLPKDALIKLLSSDSFALEEEDVWRAVLNWAKYQAGVTQPTAHWTEEERVRVGQHLSGVINHVRLLLIDSQVFAEEVEPTGAVPIELSLERYRYAALPNKYKDRRQAKRLQPRVMLFAGSQILLRDNLSFQKVLNSWYGDPKQCWRLLFRASNYDFSAEAFHRHCDGIAPVFVIALGPRGEVCGGFSDVPWSVTNTKSHYIASEKAFLFSLSNKLKYPPMKFDVVKKPFAICYHRECGPIFGAGADFLITDRCHITLQNYSNLPHSYDGENASTSILMGDYNFVVVEYEVFTVVSK